MEQENSRRLRQRAAVVVMDSGLAGLQPAPRNDGVLAWPLLPG
jgi:hypothetical protein